ncbi:MAG: NAD(P)/FAD-dependent oxidoreductase [bacterium]|nr:NAD(P)/FAD-dependent oxidoreductase [bacterium]
MHYDVAIIGAGMSGLAAGIRLAYFDRKVCIFDRHEVYGGLNSFYKRDGRQFDVGLHALTNFAAPEVRTAPLAKLLRQLRLTREQFELRPQGWSEIRFPGVCLRFTNDLRVLIQEVAESFPGEIDNFARLLETIRTYDDVSLTAPYTSARKVLGSYIQDPLLTDMLLCPVMYYGSAEEHDMDFTQFVTMFKSLFCEGLARPLGGVRTILRTLVRQYRGFGGKLRMKCGVRSLAVGGDRVTHLELDDGEQVTADVVLSSAGYFETLGLCRGAPDPPAVGEPGRLSFVESISITDVVPAELGLGATLIFFNDSPSFTYARPDSLVDVRSGVVCCPNNFAEHDHLSEGVIRMTTLADHERWDALDPVAYAQAKQECYERILSHALDAHVLPDPRSRVIYRDTFTPRTIRRFTGHLHGAVYGAPHKRRDGRTHLKNLFLCGTDQGFLGIIGAMLSGISMANLHVLAAGES